MAAAWECCPAFASHGGRGGSHQDRALAAFFHQGANGRRHAKERKGREPPAQFERLVAGVGKGPVSDLGAQVEDDDLDRAGACLDGGNSFFEGVGVGGVEQEARRGSAFAFNTLHHLSETGIVGASTQDGVIAFRAKRFPTVPPMPAPAPMTKQTGFMPQGLLVLRVCLVDDWARLAAEAGQDGVAFGYARGRGSGTSTPLLREMIDPDRDILNDTKARSLRRTL